MGSGPLEKKARHPLYSIGFFTLLLAGIAGLTYFLIGHKGYIPKIPTASIEPHESKKILEELKKSVSLFEPNNEEIQLIRNLEEIHLAETDENQGPPPQLKKLMETFSSKLSLFAQNDPKRFLLLGDFLAWRFHQVLRKSLQTGISDPGLDDAIIRFGGSFYERAVARGLITGRHLVTAEALPAVLFRYRWRRLGGIDGETEFHPIERIMLHDFIVRFSHSKNMNRRLESARTLGILLPNYNKVVAEGLIRYEAGDRAGALKALQSELKQKDNRQAQLFLNALQ